MAVKRIRLRKQPLILVKLSDEQIALAKAKNGPRKQITHALLCGAYGQVFGTEKHCLKYYEAWRRTFPKLFSTAHRIDAHPISDYESTFNLVLRLIEAHDA